MNWKFWASKESAKAAQRERELRARVEGLAADIEALYAALRFKQRPAQDQPTEPQILAALVVVDESTPLWRAVHRMLDGLEQDQKDALCQARQSDEDRHYNAGRLAMCEDLRSALLQKWTEARRQNADAQQP